MKARKKRLGFGAWGRRFRGKKSATDRQRARSVGKRGFWARAEKKVRRVEVPVSVAQPVLVDGPNYLSLEAWIRASDEVRSSLEGFLLDQRSEHTRTAYQKDLKRFMQFLVARRESRPGTYVDRQCLIAYKEWLLNEKLEHTTVDRHLATLRGVFAWLIEDGLVEKNPAASVRLMKPKRFSKTLGFSDEEVEKVLAQPNLHTRVGAQHYAILMILFYCGLRRSEICELTNSNLSRERGRTILRLRGKGNRERIIPLIEPVWNALKYYFLICQKVPAHYPAHPLFSPRRNNRTGVMHKHLDPTTIYYVVVKYAKLAGIMHKVSPHSCRATAISNARDHKVSDRAIQEYAGWASTDMITRYDKRKTAIEDSAALSIAYGGESKQPALTHVDVALVGASQIKSGE